MFCVAMCLIIILVFSMIRSNSSLDCVTVMVEPKSGENGLKSFAENFLSLGFRVYS